MEGGGARGDGRLHRREERYLGKQLLAERAFKQLAHKETLSNAMVRAGKSLALQLGNKPLQPILNGNGVAAKGNAVGPVEGPVFTERVFGEGWTGGRCPTRGRWRGRHSTTSDGVDGRLGRDAKKGVARSREISQTAVRGLTPQSRVQESKENVQSNLIVGVLERGAGATEPNEALLDQMEGCIWWGGVALEETSGRAEGRAMETQGSGREIAVRRDHRSC